MSTKSRAPKGNVRPPDPQQVLRRSRSTGRAKLRVVADREDSATEKMIDVQSAPANGATDGATVFDVDTQGNVDCRTLGTTGDAQIGGDLDVDGNTVLNGNLDVTESAAGTATPTPAFTRGRVYKESLPFALINSDGTVFVNGMNIASFTRTGTGQYTIVLGTHATAASKLTFGGATDGGFVVAVATDDHTIVVAVYQISTVPTIARADNAWSLIVYHT